MNIPETSALLAMVAANDRRTVGDIDVEVWHDALSDLTFGDCQLAVRAHIRSSREWLTPFDVRMGVRRIRADRVARAVELPPDADPDDVAAYLEALRGGRCRTASGDRVVDRRALAAAFRDVPKATPAAIEAARQAIPPRRSAVASAWLSSGGRSKALEQREHGRAYAGAGPNDGTDRGAYCPACSHLAGDYVWPCDLSAAPVAS